MQCKQERMKRRKKMLKNSTTKKKVDRAFANGNYIVLIISLSPSHSTMSQWHNNYYFVLFSYLLAAAASRQFPLPLKPSSNEREELSLRCLHVERVVVGNRTQIRHVSTHGYHRHRSVLIQRLNYSISMPGIEFTVCEINICQMSIEWTVHDVRSTDVALDGGEIESADAMTWK